VEHQAWQQRHCQCHFESSKECKWKWVEHVKPWGGMYLVEVMVSWRSGVCLQAADSIAPLPQHRMCRILLNSRNTHPGWHAL
jgi:hypothetical protein